MYQQIVKSGITIETTYNLMHIDASVTKNTEINTTRKRGNCGALQLEAPGLPPDPSPGAP